MTGFGFPLLLILLICLLAFDTYTALRGYPRKKGTQ